MAQQQIQAASLPHSFMPNSCPLILSHCGPRVFAGNWKNLVGVGSSQVTPCEGTGWPRSPQWPHASAELMLAAWQLPEARTAPHLAPAHKQVSHLVTQLALWTVCRVVEGGRDWTATAFLLCKRCTL